MEGCFSLSTDRGHWWVLLHTQGSTARQCPGRVCVEGGGSKEEEDGKKKCRRSRTTCNTCMFNGVRERNADWTLLGRRGLIHVRDRHRLELLYQRIQRRKPRPASVAIAINKITLRTNLEREELSLVSHKPEMCLFGVLRVCCIIDVASQKSRTSA